MMMSVQMQDTPVSKGLSMYEAHYFYESEEVSYNTTGKAVTADGREIEFDLSFSMSRSFEQYYEKEHTLDISKLCDPLVINLDTDIASVSDQKFLFDIDSDGVKDNISMLNTEASCSVPLRETALRIWLPMIRTATDG